MHALNPALNRLRGGLPKVGIRPTSDGRRQGVRESLENHTMAMAHTVARLITENVRHACGLPVKCVIADQCVGGIAEAVACEEKFEREGVGISLTASRSRGYGYETIDTHPTPKSALGLQRHRASESGLPRCTDVSTCQQRTTCFQHLWTQGARC